MAEQSKTQHDPSICGALPGRGPAFGRKVPGCPRCDELLAGAPARQLSPHRQAMADTAAKRTADEEAHLADMRAHFASEKHRTGGCGTVCTAFQW